MVYWRDENGKSFIYDAKGNPRLVQFRSEQEMIDGNIMFNVEFGYPKRDLEEKLPLGYSPLEKGPSIVIEVDKRAFGSDENNANRFSLLEDIERMYKRDLLSDSTKGFSNLVKRFSTQKGMEERAQLAVYLQDRMQQIVDKIVERKYLNGKEKPENGFDKLSKKQQQLVISMQNYAKEYDIKDNFGRLVTFNSKSPEPFKELDRILNIVKAHGFSIKPRNSLKPNFAKGKSEENTMSKDR